ncbi:PREDICTED: uncharacterized protein LOC104790404 [Camelina sativa]|uniref:Uncharacterized protein LOC104790404 n=1 Tax=Camelina sativa TaxID=90675 RepID=A0ABM0ZE24_CAMSA|nr:PREDICTED: uncharacterized protein LOC104790404 [Camelina sativa]
MDSEILQGHDHSLSVVYNSEGLECDACDLSFREGYSCNICKFTIHRKCAFVFKRQETFEHPSHVGHRLQLLTTGTLDHTDPKCHICDKNTKRLHYHCSICKLSLDVDCMVDAMCARAHLIMPWHHHPLLMVDFGLTMRCDVCLTRHGYGYFCPRCRLVVHDGCVSVFNSLEITHPSHVRHPLKLLTHGAPHYTDPECHICGKDTENLLYHCDMCKFNLDLSCVIEKKPPVALSNLKVHEHTLTLMPRLISFVCDACGEKGDRSPYVCNQCDYMIFHQDCAHLPRVIHVNHHDHRVLYKYPLGPGEWKCGVCWEEIDWSYGAYSCSLCPNYALHSRCAIRKDVWDGKELDGVPEEIEDIRPFKLNDDNTITYFAHEHDMHLLNKDGIALDESILCGACVRPIGSNTFYNCSDCSLVFHETCANLPQKKRHFLNPRPLSLHPYTKEKCDACLQICCEGFMYIDRAQRFDLVCCSITVPFIHGSHPHPLLYLKLQYGHLKTCQSCGINEKGVVLGCIRCNYYLDFRCATLPLMVKLPRYDDHPLTLCFGEKASGKYWCDICERETNPKTWFYTCKHCRVTLHVLCVLGDIRYAKAGGKIEDDVELLPNNRSSRPFCNNCYTRCPGPFILKDSFEDKLFCSYCCFSRFNFWRTLRKAIKVIHPPWAKTNT